MCCRYCSTNICWSFSNDVYLSSDSRRICVVSLLENRRSTLLLYVGCMGLIVCLLSAIQLLPSAEFIQLTQRGAGFSPQQSLLFISMEESCHAHQSVHFWKSTYGSYPLENFFDGNIFLENTLYISIPGIFLVAVGIMTMKTKKRKDIRFFDILMSYWVKYDDGKVFTFLLNS